MAPIKEFEHLYIQLEAIKSATDNFADESCIGRGGFGKVYRGKIGHKIVALKRLDHESKSGQGDKEYWKEVMMLSLYQHQNIVSLLGYCDDHNEKILMYEYLPNKSLDRYLNSENLSWVKRLEICIGAARGLLYLHSEGTEGTKRRLLHRDIKSSNILLDEDWNAKIGDFGLSQFGPANQKYSFVFSNAVGTMGYCDPLYQQTGLLTKESDVYSFGVVLFEVLCGRFCIDFKNPTHPSLIQLAQKSFKDKTISEIVFGSTKDEINPESLQVFAKIADQCVKMAREERPLMAEVVTALETALEYQEKRKNLLMEGPEPSESLELHHATTAQPNQLASTSNPDGPGVLVVTIHEGSGLERRNAFIFLCLGYDMRRTTFADAKNKNWAWQETFKYTLGKPAKSILKLELLSESTTWGNNVKENLGDVDISVLDVVKEKHTNKIYNIGKSRIHIELQWEPSAVPVKTKPKALQFLASIYNLL